MPKQYKTCKKQGNNEVDYWVIHPELHKKFDEVFEDQSKGKEIKEIMGTAAATTKVLSSGKVLGNPIPNNAKQELMQIRQNKYQRDKRGHIIDGANDNEVVKGKGKKKNDTVVTKNSFEVFNVQEGEKETLMITDEK